MASLKQIEANRLNAQKSTGPRSVEGKAAVRMNALKSGIDAKSTIIRGENPADLETLTNEYLEAHSPVTPQERFYVDILIRSDWQMRRLTHADAQLWEYRFQDFFRMPEDCPLGKIYFHTDTVFTRLQRHMKSLERSYKDASQELARLQSGTDDRLMSSVDSGPTNHPAPSSPEPGPQPTPDPDPPPQPIATEPTSPEIGFDPSDCSAAGDHDSPSTGLAIHSGPTPLVPDPVSPRPIPETTPFERQLNA
ncbi:MAG TPA: hypothetical protein VLY04_20990 [Bryobacteraceae bacterium]|nr:hypothetical protein [Bryobacteraceae bacterium]